MTPAAYESSWESLNRHALPGWFQDAKFGIFIHWGVFSVPAWAPHAVPNSQYYDEPAGSIPYAELYGYGLRYTNSPVWRYHIEHYGPQVHYDDFIPQFTASAWDPDAWAGLFQEIGARYCVLVTRHSDDFSLWPTRYSARNAGVAGPRRDLVGDLTAAIRRRQLKMGLYYSLTFDWYHDRYPHPPYVEYAHNQMRELIDNYQPDLLWSDDYWKPAEKSLAAAWRSQEIIAYFYNHAADPAQVLVNDRWGAEADGRQLGDYATPEYAAITDIPPFYWEMCRGIGASFGYNRAETEREYLSVADLVWLLADVVSKNGNLLLNVGPTAEGLIPSLQSARIRGLGAWLSRNGEAIYATRPWVCAQGATLEDAEVRYTRRDDAVYAIVREAKTARVALADLRAQEGTTVSLLGSAQPLAWRNDDSALVITLPEPISPETFALKLTPQPWALVQSAAKPPALDFAQTWRRCGALHIT